MLKEGTENLLAPRCLSFSESTEIPINQQIIYSIIRNCEPEELEWYLNDCIEMKKHFPDIIAGLFPAFFRNVALLTM